MDPESSRQELDNSVVDVLVALLGIAATVIAALMAALVTVWRRANGAQKLHAAIECPLMSQTESGHSVKRLREITEQIAELNNSVACLYKIIELAHDRPETEGERDE